MLCALCVPQFTQDAEARIQALRLMYDPEHAMLIGPHVTLVFPTRSLNEREFIEHVEKIAASASPVTTCFRSAMPYLEPGEGPSYLYLVPDEGYGWFTRLHARLHSGPLEMEIDPDRPYVPHVTLGKFSTFADARAAAERVNAGFAAHTGKVSSIEVVRVEQARVQRIHTTALAER